MRRPAKRSNREIQRLKNVELVDELSLGIGDDRECFIIAIYRKRLTVVRRIFAWIGGIM